jgi:hypothetical protein
MMRAPGTRMFEDAATGGEAPAKRGGTCGGGH